jgi:hypothetical protein
VIDKEKETFKAKFKELEDKCKEIENKRHEQIFAIENERNRFNMEKDMKDAQNQELKEKNESLEKRKEALLKENEALKQKNKQGGLRGGPGKDWGANRQVAGAGFAEHLMKSYAQKENGTSQVFQSGFFSKFGAAQKEGSTASGDIKDPASLPMSVKDSNKMYGACTTTPNLGSPV